MVVFGYAKPDEFIRHQENDVMYAKYIKTLKEILGDRLILIEGDIDPFEKESFEKVVSIATERGFLIDADTLTEAFGESAQICVFNCAKNFNSTGNFHNETVVDLDLTDLSNEKNPYPFLKHLIADSHNSITKVVFRKKGKPVSPKQNWYNLFR